MHSVIRIIASNTSLPVYSIQPVNTCSAPRHLSQQSRNPITKEAFALLRFRNAARVNDNPGYYLFIIIIIETINIVVWESYSDSACGNLDDDFTTSDTVYMHGTGLAAGYSYKVAYYVGINYHSADANVVATSAGNLSTDEPTDLYFLG